MLRIARAGMLTAALVAASCGGDGTYCPGLCPIDSTHPTMTIEVAGGAALLAKAEIVLGPCSSLLVRSSGEAGVPTGYAAVQVTYNGPIRAPIPICMVRMTALDGQQLDENAHASATSFEQACCAKGACCAKAKAVTIHRTVTFAESTKTIFFAPLDGGVLDGGLGDAPMDGATIDAGEAGEVDGGSSDGGGGIDASITDVAGVDVAAFDAEWDGVADGGVDLGSEI